MSLDATFEDTATMTSESADVLDRFIQSNTGLIRTDRNPLDYFDKIRIAKFDADMPWNLYVFIEGFRNKGKHVDYFRTAKHIKNEISALIGRLPEKCPIFITNPLKGIFYAGYLEKREAIPYELEKVA